MIKNLQTITKIRKIQKLVTDKRASPLVEQLIIIAVGFLILLILLGFATGIFDWIYGIADDAMGIFDGLVPSL